jgi:hypothetical protein
MFRCEWRNALGERIEARAPLLHEVRVMAAGGNHLLHHRHGNRGVGSRVGLQPKIGDFSSAGANGSITMSDAPCGLGTVDGHPLHRIRGQRISPDHQNAGRRLNVFAICDGEPGQPVTDRTAAAAKTWLIIQFGEPIDRISNAMMGPRLNAAPLTAPTSAGAP